MRFALLLKSVKMSEIRPPSTPLIAQHITVYPPLDLPNSSY